MENDTLKKEADKVINVTYMLSGVLEQSFQEMDEILDRLPLRFTTILSYNLLDKYQSLTSYPKLDSRAKIAFLQVKRDIESGQYSAEDMKNVFKLKDENRDK
nr:MAG: hypothetical protein [Bacteriophage sp.]